MESFSFPFIATNAQLQPSALKDFEEHFPKFTNHNSSEKTKHPN